MKPLHRMFLPWSPALAAFALTASITTNGTIRADDSDRSDQSAKTETFVGEYKWTSQRETGRLAVYFVETGGGLYDVEFKFRFQGTPHTYSGTAEGSLSEGALEGKVFNESKQRSWVFEGVFKDGKFLGEHAEIKRFGERRTGTLTFER